MRIVDSYARLMPPPVCSPESPFTREHGEAMLRRIEWCARISHRTEDRQDATSYERFLRSVVIDHGDWSVVEHCVISADVLVDRGLSHELVRHRLAAYTQESTRFCNYGKRDGSIDVILPPELVLVHDRIGGQLSTKGSTDLIDATDKEPLSHDEATKRYWWYCSWMDGVIDAERHYLRQIELKVAPELARDMLPHCLAVRMVMTHNLRNWRHLMIMRTTTETHRKLRPLMQNLLQELKAKVPVLFDDLEPDQKQSRNLQKGR